MRCYMRKKLTHHLVSLTFGSHRRLSIASCGVVKPTPLFLSQSSSIPIKGCGFWPPINSFLIGYLRPLNYLYGFAFHFCSSTSSIGTTLGTPTGTKPFNECTTTEDDDDQGYGRESESDESNVGRQRGSSDEGVLNGTKRIVDILRAEGRSPIEMKSKIEQCGVLVSAELVREVLSRVRNDWEAAFTFFLWAGKWPGYEHSVREYHSMISILGKMRKFDTAWGLIEDMRGGRAGPSLVNKQTLVIMIRRYCAVHDVGRAINTFYAHKRFRLDVGMEEFQNLLSALCRYKNVKDAEYLLFCNRNVFPLNTKSFNIILNGWCSIVCDPREARRIWGEMKQRGVSHDVVSYASMISCYSKFGRLNLVLKLFGQMKALDIDPDRKVYNAVIHALSKGHLVKEAHNLIKAMEEKSIVPNVVTFNSLIMPLCKARQYDEAQKVFQEMLQRGVCPTVRTYHAFFRILKTADEVFALLQKMYAMGCQPSHDTYIMLIRKFSRWRQVDNVFKLWTEMGENGLDPDRSSYIVLIYGLFLNGYLERAYIYYQEMKEKGLQPEPKIDEIVQAWVSGQQNSEKGMTKSKNSQSDCSLSGNRITPKKLGRDRDFLRKDENRKVVRERGFSFWEQ